MLTYINPFFSSVPTYNLNQKQADAEITLDKTREKELIKLRDIYQEGIENHYYLKAPGHSSLLSSYLSANISQISSNILDIIDSLPNEDNTEVSVNNSSCANRDVNLDVLFYTCDGSQSTLGDEPEVAVQVDIDIADEATAVTPSFNSCDLSYPGINKCLSVFPSDSQEINVTNRLINERNADYSRGTHISNQSASMSRSSSTGFKHPHEELPPYIIHSGSIEFHMIDFTNPAARQWMKDIIKYEVIQNGLSSGIESV